MAVHMNVRVISKEYVKPSSPTPPHLATFNISLFDQLNPSLYLPLILFYVPDDACPTTDRISVLKSSLSGLLSHFYPLAGKIQGNFSIECNDDGAVFIETSVDCSLSEVLSSPDPIEMRKLLPVEMESTEALTGDLLLVQVNAFRCGGLALGLLMSHKICDACTMGTFLTSWAKWAHDPATVEPPRLDASTYFPPSPNLAKLPVVTLPRAKCATKRYFFDSKKIAALVKGSSSQAVARPTRVEAVLGLVWKCSTTASRQAAAATSSPRKLSIFSQSVNLRQRLTPPLPVNTLGNVVACFTAEIAKDNDEMQLKDLVQGLRSGKDEYFGNFLKKEMVAQRASAVICEGGRKYVQAVNNEDLDFYNCVCWCRFPLYDVDFGWGKPAWVGVMGMEFQNSVIMLDSNGGDGIEVWLTLKEEEMAELDRDQELLEYASLNPAVIY
ncbi:hypothetical protein MLD38_008460 [Melastoma candidum]|uniref:Uncharacterized protein n=1 Tax=Melastoma candidum TaxID=119954 RepID=A0ACB9RYN9_9MYRT|nr:hypothetical protein MLD38_008460 [Melastoma candidum]